MQRRAEGSHGADGQHQHVALLGRLAGGQTPQGFRQQLGMGQGIALGHRHHGAVQGRGGVGRLMLSGPYGQQGAPGVQQPVQEGQSRRYGVGVKTEGRVLGTMPRLPIHGRENQRIQPRRGLGDGLGQRTAAGQPHAAVP